MQPLTLATFLRGPPAWRGGSSWHWALAALAAVLAFVAAQAAAFAIVHTYLSVTGGLEAALAAPRTGGLGPLDMLLLVTAQAMIVGLVWAAAGVRSRPAEALRLLPPEGGARAYLLALLAMVPVIAVINAAAWTLRPEDALRDFRFFAEIARSPNPLLPGLAICLGAPLMEELLFRGFLLAPLATVLGFWPAAILVGVAWTLLHLNYSIVGLAEVLAIGLYLSWTLWRTGSLWVPIVCHAVYNTILFLVLRLLPA